MEDAEYPGILRNVVNNCYNFSLRVRGPYYILTDIAQIN